MQRPVCKACHKRLCAVNYIKHDVKHYRSRCQACINRKRKIAVPKPRWLSQGYTKKRVCDMCGFRSKVNSQIVVYHQDGNLNNSNLLNLRSICLNCSELLQKQDSVAQIGDLDLVADD